MPSDTVLLLTAMGAYLALTIGVGLWYSRRSARSAEAYFLGERGLGPWVAAMTPGRTPAFSSAFRVKCEMMAVW